MRRGCSLCQIPSDWAPGLLMDFDELDALDPVEVPDEAARDLALVILGATGTGAPTRSSKTRMLLQERFRALTLCASYVQDVYTLYCITIYSKREHMDQSCHLQLNPAIV